ncbi:MAG: adenylyltransferase/cytidyltransferase family protein [Nanoarchaeota archaeon]
MTTVAVSGHFIYLHVGHIRLIQAAKELGDKLVVIVSNDEQQKMKKGKIIVPAKDRMEIVKAIKGVDEVVLAIDEDTTCCRTLEKVKPDIFANGGDRNQGEVPEAKVCKKYNIKMVDDVGGGKADSSSRIIEELKKV